MEKLLERFIKYVKINTTANEDTGTIPSFEGERDLAEVLKKELLEIGLDDVEITEDCFVFATIPATKGYENEKVVGLLAHLDTAPDCKGKNVAPKVHKNYDGGVIKLSEEIELSPLESKELLQYIGHDIVTTDGTTLLGADDKAGIAIIMEVAETLATNPEIKHGKIRLGFTPDEEISYGGAAVFDVKKFGADFGITVDGDGIGELNYETFNGYSYTVHIKGNNIHPAEAKGKMINASTLAMRFDSLLDQKERPELTEGREGFIHLYKISGEVEEATLEYNLRDFDKTGLEEKKNMFEKVAESLNKEFGESRVTLKGMHEYSNPRDMVLMQKGLIEACKEAFTCCGMEPQIRPIRGGTDGSTLAEKGLACVNLFLGGHNYHSYKEFVSINAMAKASEILVAIIERP